MRTKKYPFMPEMDDEANQRLMIIDIFFKSKVVLTRKINGLKMLQNFRRGSIKYDTRLTINIDNHSQYDIKFRSKTGTFYSIFSYQKSNGESVFIFTVRTISYDLGSYKIDEPMFKEEDNIEWDESTMKELWEL